MPHSVVSTHVTNVVAAGAVVSPVWLDDVQGELQMVSAVAADLLPILGCLWLGIQMFDWAIKKYREK